MTEAEAQEQQRLIAAARREGFEEGRQLGLDAGLARGLDTGLSHLGAAISTRRTPAAARESRPAARPSRAAVRAAGSRPRITTRTHVLPDRRSPIAIERDRGHGERIRAALLRCADGAAEPAGPEPEPSFNEMAAAYWESQ